MQFCALFFKMQLETMKKEIILCLHVSLFPIQNFILHITLDWPAPIIVSEFLFEKHKRSLSN